MKNEIKINNRFFYKKLVLSADSCLSVKCNGKSHTLYKLKRENCYEILHVKEKITKKFIYDPNTKCLSSEDLTLSELNGLAQSISNKIRMIGIPLYFNKYTCSSYIAKSMDLLNKKYPMFFNSERIKIFVGSKNNKEGFIAIRILDSENRTKFESGYYYSYEDNHLIIFKYKNNFHCEYHIHLEIIASIIAYQSINYIYTIDDIPF